MVYCSSSLALAALETFVNIPRDRRHAGGLQPLVAVAIDVDDGLITDPNFPGGQSLAQTRASGDTWLGALSSLGLSVPSRVIPLERNVLLNPRHPDMARVTVMAKEPFVFDDRLTY